MLYSEESEISVLGALMLEDVAFDRVVETGLQASDFYAHKHRLTFEAICHLAESGKPVDVVTVADRLTLKEQIEDAGGAAYLSRMVDLTPSIDNCEAYAEQIVDCARRRAMQTFCLNSVDMIRDGAETDEIEAHINDSLNGLADSGKSQTLYTTDESAKMLLELIQKRQDDDFSSYPTGIDTLDDILTIEGNRLYLIAGRPGMGKSTLALNIGERNAKRGCDVYFHSMEMPAHEVTARMCASMGSVNRELFKYPKDKRLVDEWSKLAATMDGHIKGLPLSVETATGRTASQICNQFRAFCRKSKSYQERGEAMLIVDYLGLVKLPGESRVKSLGEATKMFKRLSMELGVPVILLHQLNRGLEQRPNKRPVPSDLRDSGEIEEDADAVIFTYRDEVYNEDSPDKGIGELIVAKYRDGGTGTARCAADMKYSRFTSLNTQFQSQN